MREATIICLVIVSTAAFVGWLNGEDIKNCLERGNTKDYCYYTYGR